MCFKCIYSVNNINWCGGGNPIAHWTIHHNQPEATDKASSQGCIDKELDGMEQGKIPPISKGEEELLKN